MKTIALLSLLAAPLATGCVFSSSSNSQPADEPLHSAGISTNQLQASFSAQSGDSNVKVFAAVFAKNANGDRKGVLLDQNDFFTATIAGADPIVLTPEPVDGNDVTYTATLPLATAAEDIIIGFQRGNGQVSAPKTTVPVPIPFTITSSTSGSVKPGASIPVQLTPAPTSSAIIFEVVGDCVADKSGGYTAPTLDAVGKGVIDTSQITFKSGSSGCSIDLFFSTFAEGKLDPAYGGGVTGGLTDAQGEQRRAVTFAFTN